MRPPHPGGELWVGSAVAGGRGGFFVGAGRMGAKKEKLELTGGKVPRLRKATKNSFTPAKQEKFFSTLAATCNIEAACRAARVSSSTISRHRKRGAAFRARMAEAVREAYANLELMTLERMMNGTVRTITKADGSVETMHEYPNALALQLLRLHQKGAAEAQVEHDPQDIEEVRERLARRIERLRKRIEREGK
jgi:hypothetical protein